MLCYEAEIWNNVSENPNACHLRSFKFRCSVFEHIEWDSCWNSLASRWSVSQKKTMSYSTLLRWSDSVMNVLAWGPQIELLLKCFLIHRMVLTIAVGFSSLFVSENFFFWLATNSSLFRLPNILIIFKDDITFFGLGK